jgi:hypothetical protein
MIDRLSVVSSFFHLCWWNTCFFLSKSLFSLSVLSIVCIYGVIINEYLIAVGVGDVVECAASFITLVRLASPIGSAAGGSVNLSTSLSNVAKLAAHPKFVWVFNANCDGTIIYNDPV